MAKIQLVIEIEEETYQNVLHQVDDIDSISVDALELEDVVYNGIPLPKGHGRLIDADALEKKMCEAIQESSAVSVTLDTFAPTIIEADKLPNNELENPFNDSRFGG